MDPVTVSTTIGKPPEEVFDYLADIANHPEFSDHYLDGWHMTREDTWGEGAGARYRLKRNKRFQWAETTFVDVKPPYRIVGFGRGGKFNRVKTSTIWELSATGSGTRVELTIETEPALMTDRIAEMGLRRFVKRGAGKALKRLRLILEEDAERGPRATIAGR